MNRREGADRFARIILGIMKTGTRASEVRSLIESSATEGVKLEVEAALGRLFLEMIEDKERAAVGGRVAFFPRERWRE